MNPWLTFIILALASVGLMPLATAASARRVAHQIQIGWLLRIGGAVVRYLVIVYYYETGDALEYMRVGSIHAARMELGDFSWLREVLSGDAPFIGTRFIELITAFVVLVVGNSMPAAFLVFALISYSGALLATTAIRRARPPAEGDVYTRLMLYWPSMVFWPSSVGKEAVMQLAVGLFIFGYLGRRGAVHWLPLLTGMLIAFAIRPHYAAIFGLALATTQLLIPSIKLSFRQALRTVLLIAAANVAIVYMLSLWGIGAQDVQGFIDTHAALSAQGGSKIEKVEGVLSIPMAFVNMLLRPFPFESGSVPVIVSSLEVLFLWSLIFVGRRRMWRRLRAFRQDRPLRFAVPSTLLFCLILGLTFANVGIIARQRVAIFPFLFVIMAAGLARERPQDENAATP